MNNESDIPDAQPWSGWACQYPGKLPRLYGAREIAELNFYPEQGDRMFQVCEIVPDRTREKARAEADAQSERARRGFIPGRRLHICRRCGGDFHGAADAWTCQPCADAAIAA